MWGCIGDRTGGMGCGGVGKSWAFRAQALGTGAKLCSPACHHVNVSKSLNLLCFDSLPAKRC